MPKSTVSIEAKVTWVVYQEPASKYWIGVCDVLKMTLQGKSIGELIETIEESLDALFRDLVQTGELDMFLRSHGWRLRTALPPAKQRSNIRFDLPYTVERRSRHDFEGALC